MPRLSAVGAHTSELKPDGRAPTQGGITALILGQTGDIETEHGQYRDDRIVLVIFALQANVQLYAFYSAKRLSCQKAVWSLQFYPGQPGINGRIITPIASPIFW